MNKMTSEHRVLRSVLVLIAPWWILHVNFFPCVQTQHGCEQSLRPDIRPGASRVLGATVPEEDGDHFVRLHVGNCRDEAVTSDDRGGKFCCVYVVACSDVVQNLY